MQRVTVQKLHYHQDAGTMSNWVRLFGVFTLCAAIVGLTGCEFESSGDEGSFNSGPSWVNFSGVYKASSGSVLVSAFTAGGGGSGSVGGTNFVNVPSESIEQGNGVDTTFSGTLNRSPIVSGSLNITAGGFKLTDQGNGTLTGGNATGSITYGTGAWSINLGGLPLQAGTQITASYSYIVSTEGGGDDSGSGTQGSSGKAIFSFTVFQTGNKIEITDNNGARYNGQFGNVATTTGGTSADTVPPSIGDSVVAEYTAEGTSAAGVKVMMAGTFQGVVGRGSGTAMFLNDRRMLGTWVESKGVTGDINGRAAPIGISVSDAEVSQ